MKPYRLLILLLLPFSILSCREESFTDKYSSDSAVGILGIGEDIRSEKDIDEETWERVFDTEGYESEGCPLLNDKRSRVPCVFTG